MMFENEGKKIDVSYSIKTNIDHAGMIIKVDNKKITTPNFLLSISRKNLDATYVYPPGKPVGNEARLFSNKTSPVYEGYARKLGYKPLNGFQHP